MGHAACPWLWHSGIFRICSTMAAGRLHTALSLLVVSLATIAYASNYVPVYVMLELDAVNADGTLAYPNRLDQQFAQLKSANVDGVMVDVWWGIVEPQPRLYNFSAYDQIKTMLAQHGLQMQVVLSFHECGGNVGDTCSIPLPGWVLQTSGIYYKDQHGNEDREYISLGFDSSPVLVGGRTPLQAYQDLMVAFRDFFRNDLGHTITMIEVGLGPSGELRYPAYPSAYWSFCGVGEFQAWDSAMLQGFASAAAANGHPEWRTPPTDAGTYNSQPQQTNFFRDGGGYTTPYGQFFLNWYAQQLQTHGANVLAAARAVFGTLVPIAGKVAGVHWWYRSASHAAEATAGYLNTLGRNGYAEMAQNVFKASGAALLFTCMEMRDSEQPASCGCGPEELVQQTRSAAWGAGVDYGGENALARFDSAAYQEIEAQSDVGGRAITQFSYLRLGDDLLQGGNWQQFTQFVWQMHNLS